MDLLVNGRGGTPTGLLLCADGRRIHLVRRKRDNCGLLINSGSPKRVSISKIQSICAPSRPWCEADWEPLLARSGNLPKGHLPRATLVRSRHCCTCDAIGKLNDGIHAWIVSAPTCVGRAGLAGGLLAGAEDLPA